MIEVIDLHKSFDGVEVLKGVSLRVEKGHVLALIGRSGYGKSVLLKHITGLMRPDKGRVLIDRRDICDLRGRELLEMRDRMGVLFQGGALFDSMTVYDNVAFPLREKTKLNKEEIRNKVMYELAQVNLVGSEYKYPSQISGGMIKRASLARALVEAPEIMLFDEPTTGLDPLTGQTILNLIDRCHSRAKFTSVIVTHEIPKVFGIDDKVAMLDGGCIVFEGRPDQIHSSRDPAVRAFIESSREGNTPGGGGSR
ncbi:MAG: ATP-binding cassette domain-containing protein [Deltaproteobacteria bacterium]|nr:ATP-binding cassette domain-containing protein [Deltaproteobacteria bacterium]